MDLKSLLQRVDDIESNAPSFRRSFWVKKFEEQI